MRILLKKILNYRPQWRTCRVLGLVKFNLVWSDRTFITWWLDAAMRVLQV